MDHDTVRFIHYLGESDDGFVYRFSGPIRDARDLIAFVRDQLFGEEGPDADQFGYDEYMEFVTEAEKEPFDFEGTLYSIAGVLNEVGCQLCNDYSWRDLMQKDEETCNIVRKAYNRGSVDPIKEDESALFLLFLFQDVCTPNA